MVRRYGRRIALPSATSRASSAGNHAAHWSEPPHPVPRSHRMSRGRRSSAMSSMTVKPYDAHAGDRIEVSSPGGELPRRGIVIEVLGASGHQRYRVRWLDGHESIHYPSDGTRVRPRTPLRLLDHQHSSAPGGAHRWHVVLRDDVPLE